jgi:hypothetical protein
VTSPAMKVPRRFKGHDRLYTGTVLVSGQLCRFHEQMNCCCDSSCRVGQILLAILCMCLTLTDPSSRSTSVAPSPRSCSATDSKRSSASAAAPAAAAVPGLQRSTATARSFSSLQSCSSVLPTVLLGALRITQSPGCKGNARRENGRRVIGVDQPMVLLPVLGLPPVERIPGQQQLQYHRQ